MTEDVSMYPTESKDVVNIDEYSRVTKSCYKKLQEIWKDLEMSDVAQEQTLQDITQKALGVWNGAVDHAEQHRHGIRERIDNAAAEMKTIAEQLGELTAIEDPSISMGSLVISPGKTLKRQFDEVIGELETWKRKRETRISEYDSLQSSINEIRESMGMTTVCTKKVKNSITKANMDFLKLELERMRGEKVRRERKMEATLAKLRKMCIELGADDAELAASVHPSLRNYHQSMRGHYFGYSAQKPTAETDEHAHIALSEDIFRSLEGRLDELAATKEERQARLAEMHEVLQNMWRLLDISDDDDNRSFFQKMIAAPARLHAHTLEKCNEEIGRLEAEQAKAMRGMIQVKTAEMARLCELTVLPMPNLSVLVDDVESPGQVAEVLSKLVRMLAQFTVLVEQREPVMRTITEVEEGFKEAAWHHQHQQDNLFNNRGRDANRLLQRVIKAEEKKKRLPKAIARLQGLLDDWQSSNGERFVVGRVDYRAEVLDVIEAELRAMAEIKPKKPADKKKAANGKPPRDTAAAPKKAPASRALAAMVRARDTRAASPAPAERPATAPAPSASASSGGPSHIPPIVPSAAPSDTGGGVSYAGDIMSQTPAAMAAPRPRTGLNPLQDLVNSLAHASSASRTAHSDRYGACGPTMASLQVDDLVNLGSCNPSPGAAPPVLKLPQLQPPSGSAAVGAHPSENVAPSPTGSTHSYRSLQSEALSQLSINRNVTVRKKGAKGRAPSKSPSGGSRRSPAPEHSVMHTGMMD